MSKRKKNKKPEYKPIISPELFFEDKIEDTGSEPTEFEPESELTSTFEQEPLENEGFDEAGNGFENEVSEEPAKADKTPDWAQKLVKTATLVLMALLVVGSAVFWFVILRYVIVEPELLVDVVEMKALLWCCGILPIVVTLVQALLKKRADAERWLICMCVSGVAAALFIVMLQLLIRQVGFTLGELPTLLCCTVSGSALPSAICFGARLAIPKTIGYFKKFKKPEKADQEEIIKDVLSFTDFDI